MRAPNLAVKKPLESRLAPEHVFLLVVDVQNIQLPRAFGKCPAPCAQKAAQHRRAKGIEEKNNAGSGRERKFQSVAAKHAHGHARATGGTPKGKIPACNARQRGMQLHANDGAKGIIGGEQHGAAHAGAEIDEGVFVDGRERAASAPAHDHALKNRGRDRVVGRYVAVVAMPRAEMTSRNQAAGAHAEFQVEWMADQAIFFRQPGQAATARRSFFVFPLPDAPTLTIER